MKFLTATAFAGLLIAAQADAQTVAATGDGDKNISIAYHISLPTAAIPPGGWQDMTGILTKSVYDVVNHECDIVGVALKGNCRVLKLSVGSDTTAQADASGSVMSFSATGIYAIDSNAPIVPARPQP